MGLQAPFPYFGGKSTVASDVWEALGDVNNYVEPFAGSLAVMLSRPHPPKIETVNDADGYIVNFWRAVKHDPEKTASFADQPVFECDLTARHLWLVNNTEDLPRRLMADPDYYDCKIAGWWCWGLCCWIGGGWCSEKGGPWVNENGLLVKGNAGKGANKKRPHLGNAGKGVIKRLQHLSDGGVGVNRNKDVFPWFHALSNRLRKVRVCCGDWKRVTGPSVTFKNGLTGVFLDPPYDIGIRDNRCYRVDNDPAGDCLKWCLENGDNPLLRIVLAGYDGEHNELEKAGWTVKAWKASGGYANQNAKGNENRHKERLWMSPHCITKQDDLFGY